MSTTRSTRVSRLAAGPTAILGACALVLTGCTATPAPEPSSSAPREALTLKIGTILPQTGTLAQFGPASAAAVALAVEDVNEADAGIQLEVQYRDSGDATSDTGTTSVTELLTLDTSVIIGAISDGVSKKVIDQIVAANVVQISPGNVSPDFSQYDDNDLYWRTSPSCELEGQTLGTQAAEDGAATLGIVAAPESCGVGLPQAVSASFQRAGGKVAAGDPIDTAVAVDAQVAAVIAAKPDAVAIVATSQAKTIATALLGAGFRGKQLYFIGLGLGDHSADFPDGGLVGSHLTMPGLDISTLEDFTNRLLKIDPSLQDFSYAAESYDAVILAALAALVAEDTTGPAIAAKLREVSGGSGDGAKAVDFEAAAKIVLGGDVVDYDGYSGPITFDKNGDPMGAIIGVYQYEKDNTYSRVN